MGSIFVARKVAILGKLDTKFDAPFDDYNWDIWTFNKHNDFDKLPRVDCLFDLHSHNPNPDADVFRDEKRIKSLEKLVGGKYFNNSVSYLIAWAILLGYEEIALYGMRFDSERAKRREEYHNVRELIFFAKGRGIKVTAPSDPVMLQEYEPYGV